MKICEGFITMILGFVKVLQRFCPSYIFFAWIMFISLVSSIFELKVSQFQVLNLLHFIMFSLFYTSVWPISIIFGIFLIANVFFPLYRFVVSFSFQVIFISLHFTFFHLKFYPFPFLFMFFHSIVTSLFWFYSTFFLLSFMMRWLIFVLLTHFIQVC